MIYLTIFLIFAHFGLLCFGGGYVLTPIYVDELVNGRGWMTLAEFGDFLAITQMTPGPISINAATFFGFTQAGFLGSILATAGLLFPSFILLPLALHSMKRWSESKFLKGLMWGVKPATVALMVAVFVIFMELSILTERIPWQNIGALISGESFTWPETLKFRPVAALIATGCAYALCKTKIQIATMILISAILGALVYGLK